jgi:hypothetical protein
MLRASLEELLAAGVAQVYFVINGRISREAGLHFAPASPIAPRKQADQPAANSCSGLVPLPGLPGDESLMSKRPSELRDAPSRCSRCGLAGVSRY